QARLGASARGQRVVPRSADRAEQNGVRFEASVERGCRERAALKLDGGSADRAFGELELVAASVAADAGGHEFEFMTPESVGVPANRIVLGKHSGRHALAQRYTE